MYLPLEEDKLSEYEKDMAGEWTAGKRLFTGGIPFVTKFEEADHKLANCFVRYAPSAVIVEYLDVHKINETQPDKVKDMILVLTIRLLIAHAKEQTKRSLVIFSDNEMLPEILLDHGFTFRKTKSHEIGKYRGFIDV